MKRLLLILAMVLVCGLPTFAQEIPNGSSSFPLMFMMWSSSDQVTHVTVHSPTVTISKNGGSFASPSGAVTEIANGLYKVAGNATDANTNGPIWLHATGAGADPFTYPMGMVVAVNPYDAVHFGISGIPNAAAGASGGLLINGSNSGTITLAALTVTGSFTISDGLLIARSSSNTSAITATGNGTGHGALFTSGSGATGDGFKAISAATNGNGLIGVGTGTGADIKGSGLEQLVSKAVASSFSGTVAANSVIGYLADVSATSSYDRATMSFEGAYTGAPTAADLATVIWQDLLAGSDFSTSSSIGKRIKDNLDVAVSTASAGAFKTLKKGEAFTNVPIWMLSTTGAAVTGLTTSQISCQISIDGGSWTALTDTTETEIGLGKYVVDLTAGETNGNSVSLDCSATGAQHYRTNLTPQR